MHSVNRQTSVLNIVYITDTEIYSLQLCLNVYLYIHTTTIDYDMFAYNVVHCHSKQNVEIQLHP